MTLHALSRSHLEALLVARVLLDPPLIEAIDTSRLSPSALALVDWIVVEPEYARCSLGFGVQDEYQSRLAMRVEALTLAELLFFPTGTLVGLVNALPSLAARTAVRRVA